MFLIGPYSYPPGTMLSAAQTLGLTSGLVLCLDAGDINSYDGTSQTWTDVSGNSNNFYRGSGSGSDAADPTFNGTAGRQSSSEYFSGDGGDAFWQTGAQTFLNGWHKANATFTIAAWMWLPSGASLGPNLLRNLRDVTDIGVAFAVGPTGKPVLGQTNGSAVQQILAPTLLVPTNQWSFVAVGFSEGSGTSFFHVNGTSELFTDTYTSPSASTATNGVSVWSEPDTAGTSLELTVAPSNGIRTANLMAWSSQLSQSQVLSIYNATKSKFGL